MALTSNFDTLLKEYAPHALIERETEKLSWLLKKLKKDRSWAPGSNYQIPAELTPGGAMRWGSYAAADDIQQAQVAKPYISAAKALVGSMIFDQADLERHKSLEKSFLSILPKKLNKFTERMAEQINVALLGDGSIGSTIAPDATAGGVVTVSKGTAAFLENRMKIEVDDGNSDPVVGYVRGLDANAGTFTLYDAATSGSVVDLSAYDIAQSAKIYLVGGSVSTARPTSMVDLIFSAANGGADTLYSAQITKADSPIYQPYFSDISSASTGSDFLSALYDSYFEMEEIGRGGHNKEVVVPFHAFKACVKALDVNRHFSAKDEEVSYGSRAIKLMGPEGDMTIRGARGVPAAKALLIDWDAVSVACYGELIQPGKKVGGSESFEIRNSTGYQMIVDKKAEFELVGHDLQKLGGLKIATSIT